MASDTPFLSWLEPGDAFPDVHAAWSQGSAAPGLLAAGGALDVDSLRRAYASGIFPWFSAGQPILWWSRDPRMVLRTDRFKLHHSLRRKIRSLLRQSRLEVRFDSRFDTVIEACATSPRAGQNGTWIVPEMIAAYRALHRSGDAHSVETWIDGEIAGGLYFVAQGRAVFGESMFARVSDASKIALAALVAFSRHHAIDRIDCQQNTRHLASLGATETARSEFLEHLAIDRRKPSPAWRFAAVYWDTLLHQPDSDP